jgi:hypothetical protein
MKSLIRKTLFRCGISVSRSQPLKVVSPVRRRGDVQITPAIVEDIFRFYDVIPPFYDNDVPDPLRIAGAWQGDLLCRRPKQLAAIERRDHAAYGDLLDHLFRSELISGMWNHGYYGASTMVPPEVLKDIRHFEIETGRPTIDLIRKARFPSDWGVSSADGIVKFVDPYHGRQAHRISIAHRFVCKTARRWPDAKPDYVVDLGSGFGGTVSYLIEWATQPFNLMLVDIPLNLTTAYAYLASQYLDLDITLASSSAEIDSFVETPRGTRIAVLLVPTTLLAEALTAVRPVVLHNSASFSEMDLETVRFYLEVFAQAGTRCIVETNSGQRGSVNTGGHREVTSWDIEGLFASDYVLVSRAKVENVRYVTSIYMRRCEL